MTQLVVGADVGGTATRVAVAGLDGTVHAVAVAGPGNPATVGLEGSAGVVDATVRRALEEMCGEVATGAVASVALGLAGAPLTATEPGFLPIALASLPGARVALVSDLTVAFCSATPAVRGCVLVAGTGAVAGRVDGDDVVEQRDGWGWLLGDEGSGFWLGRAAVRATLAALQRGQPLGALGDAVLRAAGAEGYPDLLQACYRGDPAGLAAYSPLVSRYADTDPVAAAIADDAAAALDRLLASLWPVPGEPVVLAGSLLTTPGPVLTRFLARATRPGPPLTAAGGGVVGALWIALRGLGETRQSTHDRLVTSAARWVRGQAV